METRRVLATTLIAALALSVAGLVAGLTTCGSVAPIEVVTEPTPLPIDKGTPEPIHEGTTAIEMRVGDTHTVALESNPTTGYQWALGSEYDERFLELVEQSFEPDSDLIGAPGRELFTFRALAFGMVEFSFNYKRPWEDRVLKTGRYTFVIGVSAALADEMSEAEAREIAANSECGKVGALKEDAFYNDWSGTWWIDLDAQKEHCPNPACVIWLATKQAEVNWRCMGVPPPPTDEVPPTAPLAPLPPGAPKLGHIQFYDPQLGYQFEYPEGWQIQRPEVADGEDVESVVMFFEPGTPTTLVVT